jgi:post-segregation antitoxin (ccd killing protein)
MRDPLFDAKAVKQTVSITLNSDLYAKAKGVGINASAVAEEALAGEYARRRAEVLLAELRQDLAVAESYAEKHGSFAQLVREHYEREDGSVRDNIPEPEDGSV